MCEASTTTCAEAPVATCGLCGAGYCTRHQAATPSGNTLLVCTSCRDNYWTADSEAVPGSLATAHERWVREGRPKQEAFRYRRQAWIGSLPEYGEFISGLPDRLSRSFISNLGRSAHEGEREAAKTFIAMQIWGYGANPKYGPFRTEKALSTPPSVDLPITAAQRLQAVALVLRQDGNVEAYRVLGREYKLDRLGPSFGTKYLFFVSAIPGRAPALVLDSLVSGWLESNTGLRLDSNSWSHQGYGEYLFAMYSWAADLGEPPDTVEFIIFRNS